MRYVKNMVGDHEDHLREMDCDMARLKLELVELQSLREGFKHFIADHWLPLIQYLHSFPTRRSSDLVLKMSQQQVGSLVLTIDVDDLMSILYRIMFVSINP